MMLRNRNLNVQEDGQPAAAGEPPKAGAGGAPKPNGGAVSRRRQAPASNCGEEEEKLANAVGGQQMGEGPKPKKTCPNGTTTSEDGDEQSSSSSSSDSTTIGQHQNLQQITRHATNTSNSPIIQGFSNTLCINSANRPSILASHNNDENVAPTEEREELAIPVEPKEETEEETNEAEEEEEPIAQEQLQLVQPAEINFEFDQESAQDMSAVTEYVLDIFNYYKHRERFFRVGDYLGRQPHLNFLVRANIVNWIVELQENFELNHETLYLGVKLFDMFIDRTPWVPSRGDLQMIASAAVFIASKFDERQAPLIDDFIYMADEAYGREEMMAMERQMLCVVQFDLGAPLSYRFLRRYARVTKENMGTLTLARYALELSLMSLRFCRMSESKIAAAALLLAKRMKAATSDVFMDILQKCSGFPIDELLPLMWELNRMLIQREQMFGRQNDNVFRKYSHEIFHEVAKIPPLPMENILLI